MLAVAALVRAALAFVALCALLFLPAGTFDYPQAWAYLGVLFGGMAVVLVALLRYDPERLRRRLEAREREPVQRKVVLVGTVVFVGLFAVAGFDRRAGWSEVPVFLEVASLAGVACGYAGFIWVLRANRWASRTIGVEDGQTLVTTGPYARVRHPMYVAVLVLYGFTPTALGSWVALPFPTLLGALLVARIRNEEEVLLRGLPGYEAYVSSVRYRLVPGVW
jgi:protein-S-isoprenylcysteine O-methyltransferase Ste14